MGSAIALGANAAMSGFVVVGAAQIVAGVVAGEVTIFTAAVLGAEARLAVAGALILKGGQNFAKGAFPGALTAIAVGGDIAGGNFSWWQSLLPVVGLPSAIEAVGRNCGGS